MVILRTGLTRCYDTAGKEIDCAGSAVAQGQDAAQAIGLAPPEPRFAAQENIVQDQLTGLIWSRSANPLDFPMNWEAALAAVQSMGQDAYAGRNDWRLPNRRELRSLINHGAARPSLSGTHPFSDVFQHWVWTSTTSAMAPGYAWCVHLAGGRMFYGKKDAEYVVWPVAGESGVLPQTGQKQCFDAVGAVIDCAGAGKFSGQDGELQRGVAWPTPRFTETDDGIQDRLTGLVWARKADLAGLTNWEQALQAVDRLAQEQGKDWRLPNINELESLVDASQHSPALPAEHPFEGTGEAYWSSTTSAYESGWSYCLYLHKGAVGVGHKAGPEFFVWPARGNIA